MIDSSFEFYLPLGLAYNDTYLKKGHMHLATTADELAIQESDEVSMNTRYRDIMLFSKVIDDLDGVSPVTVEMLEELYEADFLFLQLLYKEVNGELSAKTLATCPHCGVSSAVQLPKLFVPNSAPIEDGSEA